MHFLKYLSLSLVLFLSLINPCQAFHFDSLPDDTQDDLKLVQRIIKNPRLLHPKYLECFTGPKSTTMTGPLSKSKSLRLLAAVNKVSWLDKNESYPRYTFEQGTTLLNKSIAEFSFAPTHVEDIRIQDINKITDKEPNKSFDEEGHPMVSYLINPNLKVFAYEDSRIVNVNRIAVQYIGPALPPLTPADMDEAIQFRRDAAFEHSHHGRHAKAISLLHAHLRTNPNDVEAHLKLAESYKANSYLNEAIVEYKTTLAMCGNNSEIHDRCIEGLHALKIDLPNNSLPATNLPTNSSPAHRRININPPSSNSNTPPSDFDSATDNKIKSLDVGF